MLLEDMNISRLTNHAEHFKGGKLREQATKSEKHRIGNYDNSQQKLGGVTRSQFQQKLQHLDQLVFYLSCSVTIKKLVGSSSQSKGFILGTQTYKLVPIMSIKI